MGIFGLVSELVGCASEGMQFIFCLYFWVFFTSNYAFVYLKLSHGITLNTGLSLIVVVVFKLSDQQFGLLGPFRSIWYISRQFSLFSPLVALRSIAVHFSLFSPLGIIQSNGYVSVHFQYHEATCSKSSLMIFSTYPHNRLFFLSF